MKDGVSISKGSKDIPNHLKLSTVWQALMYIWCYFVLPIGLATNYFGNDGGPPAFFVGVLCFCCACVFAMNGPTTNYIENLHNFKDTL